MALIAPIPVNPGTARVFRENINTNFENMKSNAASVNAEVDTLRGQLKPVAFSGEAKDLTTDATHRVVTDQQKEDWGKRLTIQTEQTETRTQYHIFQDGVDQTTNIQTLFNTGSWKPTATSQLINDSGFIQAAGLTSSTAVYIENVTVTKVSEGTPVETGSEFTTKWSAVCSDGTRKCTEDMVPTIVLNQEDSITGNWSQVCQSGDGVVYIWSKPGTASNPVNAITLKAVYAVLPVRLTPPTP